MPSVRHGLEHKLCLMLACVCCVRVGALRQECPEHAYTAVDGYEQTVGRLRLLLLGCQPVCQFARYFCMLCAISFAES